MNNSEMVRVRGKVSTEPKQEVRVVLSNENIFTAGDASVAAE
jgi:hypothetical protein